MFKGKHVSVLLRESVDGLNVVKGGLYLDCNLGGGGHTEEILRRGGRVIAVDVDKDAIEFAEKRLGSYLKSGDLKILKLNFRDIDKIPAILNENFRFAGVLYDLGLSTFQLKEAQKGFSFMDSTELDMRMDQELNVKAQDLLKVLSERELEKIILMYGEDPQARIFAKAIKAHVNKNPSAKILAADLGEIIRKASRYPTSKIHPATRVFQALRIAVNDEIGALEESLNKAIDLLSKEGRLVIISFHSLEDKLSKNLSKNEKIKTISVEPIMPTEEEISLNTPSRSAKMRIYEKL
jgi:16S rRNA (cytosine1402-N4)-methyltransferase